MISQAQVTLGFALSIAALAYAMRERVSIAVNDTIDKLAARGIRNNNPGNIVISGIPWRNKIPVADNTDGVFEQFPTAFDGIRIIGLELRASQRKGQRTIAEIITEWAPPSENDTDAYIRSVARLTGLPANAPLNVSAELFPLTKAIIHHENGQQPYPDQLILQALAAA